MSSSSNLKLNPNWDEGLQNQYPSQVLITCPKCETQYQVTNEDLKRCQHTVRCTKCLNVWNLLQTQSVQVQNNPEPPIIEENYNYHFPENQDEFLQNNKAPINNIRTKIQTNSHLNDEFSLGQNNMNRNQKKGTRLNFEILLIMLAVFFMTVVLYAESQTILHYFSKIKSSVVSISTPPTDD